MTLEQDLTAGISTEFVVVTSAVRDARGRTFIRALLHNYDLNGTSPNFVHFSFLKRVFERVMKDEPDTVASLVGKADRKNRSGDSRVNDRVARQRAEQAANALRFHFTKNRLNAADRIRHEGRSDADAIRRLDADQKENSLQRAVEFQVFPWTST